MTGVHMRRNLDEDTHTEEEHHVMTKAETGIMQLQAKEHQHLLVNHQKVGRGKKIISYKFQGVAVPADSLILDL